MWWVGVASALSLPDIVISASSGGSRDEVQADVPIVLLIKGLSAHEVQVGDIRLSGPNGPVNFSASQQIWRAPDGQRSFNFFLNPTVWTITPRTPLRPGSTYTIEAGHSQERWIDQVMFTFAAEEHGFISDAAASEVFTHLFPRHLRGGSRITLRATDAPPPPPRPLHINDVTITTLLAFDEDCVWDNSCDQPILSVSVDWDDAHDAMLFLSPSPSLPDGWHCYDGECRHRFDDTPPETLTLWGYDSHGRPYPPVTFSPVAWERKKHLMRGGAVAGFLLFLPLYAAGLRRWM